MVILTGPATDEFVGPNRRQGFLDGLKEGGLQYEIMAEQSGDYAQDKGQVAAENMLAGNPDIDLILGLNDSMALGAYNVVNGKDQYKNVYVAASADGQKEALALIKQGGCEGRYISTGLNSPSLAAEEALKISVDVATGKTKPARLPAGVLHQGGRHRLREHRRVLAGRPAGALDTSGRLAPWPDEGPRQVDDAGDPLGMSQHEEADQVGTERVPDQNGAFVSEGVEQAEEVADVAGDGVLAVPPRTADAALVIAVHDGQVGQQVGYRSQVVGQTRTAVHQHQRWGVLAGLAGHPGPQPRPVVQLDELHGHDPHPRPSVSVLTRRGRHTNESPSTAGGTAPRSAAGARSPRPTEAGGERAGAS